MEQEPQLFQKQSTSKTKKILVLAMTFLLVMYWVIFVLPIFSSLNKTIALGSDFYLPNLLLIISTVLVVAFSYYFYKKLNLWDKLFRILSAIYIFMMISFIFNMIFSEIYIRYNVNNYNNIESAEYITVEPVNTLFTSILPGLLAEVLALIFIWFYIKIEVSKK